MDIQKVKELALANGFKLKEQADGSMDLNAYVYDFANAIEREVKAQAVPEGYKLVPIDSVAVNKKEIPAIREALHIMNFKHGDVRDDFASADAAIEKAIEATQEPAND